MLRLEEAFTADLAAQRNAQRGAFFVRALVFVRMLSAAPLVRNSLFIQRPRAAD